MTEPTKKIKTTLYWTLAIGWFILLLGLFFWYWGHKRGAKSVPVLSALNKFDVLFNSLDPGQIAFGAPSRMGYGETKQANLLLSKIKSIPELEQTLQETGIVRGHTIKVADIMEAHLTGNDFDILPVTPEVQPISGRETTEWKWDIKPKDFGSLPLHLSVNAKIMLDGQERTRPIRTFDETVYVQVAWSRSIPIFIRNNWQWLWTTLIVPIAGWVWHRRRKAGKKKRRK
jgi:hypothetical protein